MTDFKWLEDIVNQRADLFGHHKFNITMITVADLLMAVVRAAEVIVDDDPNYFSGTLAKALEALKQAGEKK